MNTLPSAALFLCISFKRPCGAFLFETVIESLSLFENGNPADIEKRAMKTAIISVIMTIILVRVFMGVLFWILQCSSVQKKTSSKHSAEYLEMVSKWIASNRNHFDTPNELCDSVNIIFGVTDKSWIINQGN